MADWSQLVKGFQQGAEFSQDFRARKQIERAREQALESGQYDLEGMRMNRNNPTPMEMDAGLGGDMPSYTATLGDPFAERMGQWFSQHFGKGRKKKRKAIDTGGENAADIGGDAFGGSSNPGVSGTEGATAYGTEENMAPYADGGRIPGSDSMLDEEDIKRRAAQNRTRSSERGGSTTENVRGADRTVRPEPKAAAAEEAGTVAKRGLVRRALNSKLGKAAGALATAGAVVNATDDDYDERANERFPYLSSSPEQAAEGGFKEGVKYGTRRALMFASDLGNNLSGGMLGKYYGDNQQTDPAAAPAAAPGADPEQFDEPFEPSGGGGSMSASMSSSRGFSPRHTALPAMQQPEIVDFSDLDVDHDAVPNMQTDDWKQYRAKAVQAARATGKPGAVQKAMDDVTQMQIKGFLAYGQQGLALQNSGNVRGAMNAYRAAFQYFPNGNDVEFGTHKDRRTGRSQIVGFGKDEKTKKVIPGSEIVMDPERVAAIMQNFSNPQAWLQWTKDHRDEQFKERTYQEVTKPLAQAQADYMANNAEARGLAAENQALRLGAGGAGAGYKQSDMRGDAAQFTTASQNITMDKPEDAEALADLMSRVKMMDPSIPGPAIVNAVKQAYATGGQVRPSQIIMMIRRGTGAGAAPRQALPMAQQPEEDDPTLAGLSPEERAWATTPAQ